MTTPHKAGLIAPSAVMVFLAASPCLGQTQSVMIGLDVSLTMEATCADNVAAVWGLLKTLKPGTTVTVFTVAERGFPPLIILEESLPEDLTVFGADHYRAVARIEEKWLKASKGIRCDGAHTDLLGAFAWVAYTWSSTSLADRVLLWFTDGRQETSDLDLETPSRIDVQRSLQVVEAKGLLMPLSGAVCFLGVVPVKSPQYMTSLRDFWLSYVQRAGAQMASNDFSARTSCSLNSTVSSPAGGPMQR